MEKDNPPDHADAPGQLLKDSTVVLAAGTLWLYLVVAMHLRGYLSAFGAHADWFEPGLFRLISFNVVAILLTVLLAGLGLHAMLWGLPRLRPPAFSTLGWVLGLSALAACLGFTRRGLVTSSSDVAAQLFFVALMFVTSIAGRVVVWRVLSGGAEAPEAVAELYARLRAAPRTLVVFSVLFVGYLVAGVASLTGTASAGLAAIGIHRELHPSVDEPARGIHVLFTDGMRSLTFEWRNDTGGGYCFRNPEAGQALWLKQFPPSKGTPAIPTD